eukprot:CAMPEP_0168608502 /NCGR_PEP_ID=MMETSP0449_2-20121227/660_1 /TAXON_ID=1082188 /ORGANISM="Strombidium rassoulzadegani, Strain ras09" /LENGTH=225 /DNA_ID=CAMNT_0008648489 /DNA_START=41 /DNA_END=718 /DNA_ORIENTATION=-
MGCGVFFTAEDVVVETEGQLTLECGVEGADGDVGHLLVFDYSKAHFSKSLLKLVAAQGQHGRAGEFEDYYVEGVVSIAARPLHYLGALADDEGLADEPLTKLLGLAHNLLVLYKGFVAESDGLLDDGLLLDAGLDPFLSELSGILLKSFVCNGSEEEVEQGVVDLPLLECPEPEERPHVLNRPLLDQIFVEVVNLGGCMEFSRLSEHGKCAFVMGQLQLLFFVFD